MKQGKVYLIGSGPSDYGLLTIKAKYILDKADVIVYDKLVGDSILSSISPDKEFINVGKSANNHTVCQNDINKILLNKALKGKIVARLKGGDPFLFGRGGEELDLLVKNNIPFEVIPGITSAISVPCYNGIPVTHREISSSVHIITAHKKNNEELDIDFKTISKLSGTLIFLMGVASLKIIVSELINNEKDKKTPCAILEKGTTSKQRKIVATLDTICELADKENIKSPSIIVVGDVCSLSNKFDWYVKKPLHNAKVVITRPLNQQSTLREKLYNLGAEVVQVNNSIIKYLDFELPNSLEDFSHIVFTSQNGVKSFFKHLTDNNIDIRNFSHMSFCVVGKSTFDFLKSYGIIADIIPNEYSSINLAKEIKNNSTLIKKIILIHAKSHTDDLPLYFNENKISYLSLTAYENIFIQNNCYNVSCDDYILFTSASSVKRFANAYNKLIFSDYHCICIGNKTEIIAKKYGFQTTKSNSSTIDSIIETLIEIHKNKS